MIKERFTMANFRKWNICIAQWCCMCKKSGKSKDHLLLHCVYSSSLWSLVFRLFGLQWVMPKRVVDVGLLERGLWHTLFCWLIGGCYIMLHMDYLERTQPLYFWRGWVVSGHFFSTLGKFLDLWNLRWHL